MSIRKNRTEKSCGIHSNLPMAVGYEMKARPVPLFTTSSTSTFSSCARLPANGVHESKTANHVPIALIQVTQDGKDDESGEHRGAGVGDGYDQRVPVDVVRELRPDSIGLSNIFGLPSQVLFFIAVPCS